MPAKVPAYMRLMLKPINEPSRTNSARLLVVPYRWNKAAPIDPPMTVAIKTSPTPLKGLIPSFFDIWVLLPQ